MAYTTTRKLNIDQIKQAMYVDGSAAPKLQTVPVRRKRQPETSKQVLQAGKNRNRTMAMNIGYLVFLIAATIICMVGLTWYLSLQAELTNSIKRIAVKEKQLNELRLDNDENYSRISSSVNLEEVRRIAIQELGMTYAKEGQIISIDGEGSDYVRQTGIIPD